MTNDVAGPVPLAASAMTLENYAFPAHRLLRQQTDPERIPLVLVACGSFSPITYLHLRMFEMANDYARINTQYEVVGGCMLYWFIVTHAYGQAQDLTAFLDLSPVSDAYKKAGLAESRHR